MTELSALWLPIIVSTGLVFFASSAIHNLGLWHRNDFPAPPSQDRVRDALRPLAIPPGEYMVPRASGPKEMRTPEFAAKVKEGPVVMMTVLPNGRIHIGKQLALWIVYCAAVGVFAAYVSGRALPHGAPYLHAFRFAGATAFIGYAVALWQDWIWYGRSASATVKSTLDGLIYALLTAGTFGWLWP